MQRKAPKNAFLSLRLKFEAEPLQHRKAEEATTSEARPSKLVSINRTRSLRANTSKKLSRIQQLRSGRKFCLKSAVFFSVCCSISTHELRKRSPCLLSQPLLSRHSPPSPPWAYSLCIAYRSHMCCLGLRRTHIHTIRYRSKAVCPNRKTTNQTSTCFTL